MNLLATTLVMGILFLPGSTSATTPVASATSVQASASGPEEPSPSTVAVAAKTKVQPVSTNAYHVTLTAYNAVPSQTDGDPGTTASGISSNSEVVAARSQDLAQELPFGTVIQITRAADDTPGCNFHAVEPKIGYRVIADTMNARWTDRVDVELDSSDKVTVDGTSMNPAEAIGVCGKVTVKVVGHIPLSQIPKTQAGLASIFAPRVLAINK